VTPGQRNSTAPVPPATPAATPLKPRGCQHGPAERRRGQVNELKRDKGGSTSPVVEDLIGAVKQLTKQG
jgi:hypothetical protein